MKKKTGILVILMAAFVFAACGQKAVIIVEKKKRCGHRPHRFNYEAIILFPDYDAFSDAEGLSEGEGDAALSREALMALNSTMEVYLLSSEYVIFSSD